jgi:glycosyltransferase involved in cell wall biosynthesis
MTDWKNSQDANGRPTVSVIIPTRNRRALLALALGSALDQRGVELEVIVVDEGSTDDTSAMIGRIGDRRVRLVRHETPLGKSAARNRGIAESQGEWIAFLDDDDIWAPDKLRLQLQAIQETGRHWAYAGAVNITLDHRVLGGGPPQSPVEVAASLPHINSVPGGCSSVLVSRRSLPAAGFDAAHRLCEDWDLWIRLAQTGLPAAVPKPVVGYRVHPNNSSVDTARLLAEVRMIQRRYGGPIDWAAFYRHLGRVCLRTNRQWQSLGYYVRAAACDRGFSRVRTLASDVRQVLRTVDDKVKRGLGRPKRAPELRRSNDQHSAWTAEARVWLEQFVHHHVRHC